MGMLEVTKFAGVASVLGRPRQVEFNVTNGDLGVLALAGLTLNEAHKLLQLVDVGLMQAVVPQPMTPQGGGQKEPPPAQDAADAAPPPADEPKKEEPKKRGGAKKDPPAEAEAKVEAKPETTAAETKKEEPAKQAAAETAFTSAAAESSVSMSDENMEKLLGELNKAQILRDAVEKIREAGYKQLPELIEVAKLLHPKAKLLNRIAYDTLPSRITATFNTIEAAGG